MLATVISVMQFVAWGAAENDDAQDHREGDGQQGEGRAVQGWEASGLEANDKVPPQRQKSSPRIYVSALARIVKGNSVLIAVGTAFVSVCMIRALFYVQLGWTTA